MALIQSTLARLDSKRGVCGVPWLAVTTAPIIIDGRPDQRLTERILGDDRFRRQERFALSLLVDRRHAELTLLAELQSGDFALGAATELADRLPVAFLVLLFDDVVAHRLSAIFLIDGGQESKRFII